MGNVRSSPSNPQKGWVSLSRGRLHEPQNYPAHSCLKIADLKHQLAGYNRNRFGVRSESLDQLQLSLVEDEEIAVAAEASEPKNNKPHRKPLPEHLERKERYLHPATIAVGVGDV